MSMDARYVLQNYATGRVFDDSGWLLSDPLYTGNTLIRAMYHKKQLDYSDHGKGFYRFADWLPVNRILPNSAAPVTYKSEALARHIGLRNLYITFSGYWPERGAFMKTCSFKETEAYSVCAHIPEDEKRTMVVASAGNTARAFAKVCSDNKIPLLLFVPYDNLDTLWFDKPLDPCVQLVCSPPGTDYFDAIELSNKVCEDANRPFCHDLYRSYPRLLLPGSGKRDRSDRCLGSECTPDRGWSLRKSLNAACCFTERSVFAYL